MFFTDDISRAVSVCIERRIPFVAFAYPQSDTLCFFADPDVMLSQRSDMRFVVSSWCGGANDEYVICDKAGLDSIKNIVNFAVQSKTVEAPVVWQISTPRKVYDESLDLAIEHLQNCGGKIVISRTICGDSEQTDWISVADRYFNLHPEAFRYIYFTPRHGFWLGASPELLLKVENGCFTTMALAGTREKSEADKSWSHKNIAEQAVVRDYIVDKLYDLGLNPKCQPTETVTTGNIQHLMTVIRGSISTCSPREILRTLNPTPALAGYPLSAALEQIAALEKHPRRCYGGYVAVENGDKLEAYVNLRNVNFDSKRWCMYVGSGIMPDSDIDDEWNETEAKSLILKQLIEDSQT